MSTSKCVVWLLWLQFNTILNSFHFKTSHNLKQSNVLMGVVYILNRSSMVNAERFRKIWIAKIYIVSFQSKYWTYVVLTGGLDFLFTLVNVFQFVLYTHAINTSIETNCDTSSVWKKPHQNEVNKNKLEKNSLQTNTWDLYKITCVFTFPNTQFTQSER